MQFYFNYTQCFYDNDNGIETMDHICLNYKTNKQTHTHPYAKQKQKTMTLPRHHTARMGTNLYRNFGCVEEPNKFFACLIFVHLPINCNFFCMYCLSVVVIIIVVRQHLGKSQDSVVMVWSASILLLVSPLHHEKILSKNFPALSHNRIKGITHSWLSKPCLTFMYVSAFIWTPREELF